jgi:TetR/AcrR family transcriptional regulator, tetracycline repressor protein
VAAALQVRRDDVLRGARALLDDEGLDGLTMRRLGASLRVQPAGLYAHFPSKQALLAAMAADLVAGVAEPPAGPWDQRLATLAHSLRRSLLGVRDGARLVADAFLGEPHAVLAGATGVRILTDDAGLPAEQAAWSVATLAHYVVGHAIQEQATEPETRRFEYGLALVLDGIRRRV